jgi:ABC-2 type transport system permease protein
MGKLFVSSVKMLYRDKQALFWAMAFPVIFAVVFGLFDFSQSPEVSIAVVAESESEVSTALVDGLKEVDSFEVETREDLAAARREVVEGDLGVVIGVPQAPSPALRGAPVLRRQHLAVYYNESNFESNQFALSAIERIVDGLNLRLAGVERPAVAIEAEAVKGRSLEYYDFLLPGLVAMGVMNFAITGMAIAISRYREQRILKRILATPLRPAKFLVAQVLARLVLSVFQAGLILAVGVFAFGANVYGNILWIFVLATLANLVFLNIGFAVAGRAANPDAAQGIAQAVALPMMFLSGVFFPTDTLPNVVQAVVKWLPLTPLLEALRKVSVEGLSITDTGPQMLMLGGWVIVSFFLATRFFRFARA